MKDVWSNGKETVIVEQSDRMQIEDDNPRGWEGNFGTVVCLKEDQYPISDAGIIVKNGRHLREMVKVAMTDQQIVKYIKEKFPYIYDPDCSADYLIYLSDDKLEEMIEQSGYYITVPFYIVDHGMWGIRTYDVDTSIVHEDGFIYCIKNDVLEDSLLTESDVKEILTGELLVYNDYIEGNVYCYEKFIADNMVDYCDSCYVDRTESKNSTKYIADEELIFKNNCGSDDMKYYGQYTDRFNIQDFLAEKYPEKYGFETVVKTITTEEFRVKEDR